MIKAIQTNDGFKLRRQVEPQKIKQSAVVGQPPIPGAVYDSIAGVWRRGAFIVPTAKTISRVPHRTATEAVTGQEARIRAMSDHTDASAVKAALRRQNKALQLDDRERLELALAMALLDAGIDPVTVQGDAKDEGWAL